MAVGQEVLRYVGGTVGPENDGWIVIIEGDSYVKTVGNSTITGNLTATNLTATAAVAGSTLASTVAIGTAPLTVTSTTKVVNLNADQLDGLDSTAFLQTSGGSIASGTLSFGSAARQMLNLYSTSYGIGVQSSTLYMRYSTNMAWHHAGVHSNTALDPGAAGTLAMNLDGNGDLFVRRNVTVGNAAAGGLIFKDTDLAGGSTWKVEHTSDNLLFSYGSTTKLTLASNGDVTFTGSLTGTATTFSSNIDAGGSNLTLQNSGVSTSEGGELTLVGKDGVNYSLDVFNDYFRVHNGSLTRLAVSATGRLLVYPVDSGENLNMVIYPNAGTSNRAVIGYGDPDGTIWETGTDFGQNGNNDFFMYSSTAGQIFSISSNGDTYWNKSMIWPNSITLWAKDTGGNNKIFMYPRWSDNATYIDGGTALHLRVNDGTTNVTTIDTDGYMRTRGHRVFHGAMGNQVASFDGSGFAYIAHGLGASPVSVVASPASTFDNGAGVYSLHVYSWDATNIAFRAIRVDNGAYAVSPRTLAIRWMAGFY